MGKVTQFPVGDDVQDKSKPTGDNNNSDQKWQSDLDSTRKDGTYQKVLTQDGSQGQPDAGKGKDAVAAGVDKDAGTTAAKDATKGDKNAATAGDGKVVEKTLQDLDPKYKDMNMGQMWEYARKTGSNIRTIEEAKSAFREIVARTDMMLPNSDFDKAVKSADLLQKALEAGKDVRKNDDGSFGIDPDKDLTPERRWDFHAAVTGDLETVGEQIRSRMEFSKMLKLIGQTGEADKVAQEAVAKSNMMTKPVDTGDGKTTTLLDLAQKEITLLGGDKGKFDQLRQRQDIDATVRFLKGDDAKTGIVNLPRRAEDNLKFVQKKSWW